MAEERVQRRLAAILVAAVAGYSRLLGEDDPAHSASMDRHLRNAENFAETLT